MRVTLLAATLALTSCAVFPLPAAKAADRPNVLFLFADDMRPDCIGALGNPVIKTPHLDELVRRGYAFDNAYCMAPPAAPSATRRDT